MDPDIVLADMRIVHERRNPSLEFVHSHLIQRICADDGPGEALRRLDDVAARRDRLAVPVLKQVRAYVWKGLDDGPRIVRLCIRQDSQEGEFQGVGRFLHVHVS